MRKKVWVPEVLRRIFGDKIRTLANTILSLISHHPPPPFSQAHCRCKGRGCLRCCGMSFLLRPDDPCDYRNLLNQCFVAINDDAPSLLDFYPDSRWPQHEIVARSIEMIIYEHSMFSNVICSDYDKYKRSSPIVESLTCLAWDLLLKRVGDDIMIYLLKWTSIFLALPHKKHCQVAGPPFSNVCLTLLKQKSEYQCPSLIQFSKQEGKGPQKKRKRVDNVNSVIKRQQLNSFLSVDGPLSCAGCNSKNYLRPFIDHCERNCGQRSFSEAAISRTGAHGSNGELENSSNCITLKLNKCLRPSSKQRSKKRRQLNFQDCATICSDEDSLTKKLQRDFDDRLSHFDEKMPGQCSCCLTLQAPRLVTHADQISRQSMFYNLGTCSLVLPRNHVLNTLKPNFSGSKVLLENIFGLSDVNANAQSISCFHSSGFCRIGSACLYHSLLKSLKILIQRTKCCQHLRLLDKHCLVPSVGKETMKRSSSIFQGIEVGARAYEQSHGYSNKNCKTTVEAGDPQFDAVKSYCLKSQVVSFIWAVCRRIVPADFLGTPSNWRILRKNIAKFIGLRRFEKFSVRQCLYKMKASRFPFLSNKHSTCYLVSEVLKDQVGQSVHLCSKLNDAIHSMKQKLLVNWIVWLFSSIVVPLVQSNFYVTESQQGKHDVCYYRKSIWKKLTKGSIIGLNDKSYIHLDEAAVRDIINKRTFGFSKVRLLPKLNGVRIVANLNALSRLPAQKPPLNGRFLRMDKSAQFPNQTGQFDYFKSVNCVLRDTHAVLKGIQLKEPEKLGSSVFDYNDVYRKLCPFLLGLKNGSTIMPGVFIVVSDVAKAFDTIDQDKMLTVMEDVISKGEYHLEQSYQVVCTKKSLRVRENLMSLDVRNGFTRFTTSVPSRSLHSILINQGKSWYVKKEKLFFDLDELVKRNVLQLDRNFYLQGRGIPQGSILSPLLCSLYYGHLERNVIFPFLDRTCQACTEDLSRSHNCDDASAPWDNRGDTMICPGYILLRFTDDFLFISTSKKQAASFFAKLQRGFQDYNCFMNEEKFGVNFDISGLPTNRAYVGDDGISFLQWSGLLINCCTLEVQADYTRYLNNHLRSTLTISWEGKPGHHLKSKLRGYMRPKCHAIFFDSNINSAAVVRLNIYQAFLLCAMKFHCYVCELSNVCRLHSRSYFEIIEGSLRYMYVLIKKRMRSPYLGNLHPILQLEEGEVQWLGLYAYVEVLKRKQSRHRKLLSLLRSMLLTHKLGRSLSCKLKYAVDRSHSSLLWKIKF